MSNNKINKLLAKMRQSNKNIDFDDLVRVCNHYFELRGIRGSHHVYKTPWQGDPRINLQKKGSKAKDYQVNDVLEAIEKLNSLPHPEGGEHER